MDAVLSQAVELWWMVQDNFAMIGGLLGFGAFFATVIQYMKTKLHLDERVLRFTKNIKLSGKAIVNTLLIVMTVAATVLETALNLFDVFPNAAVALPTIYLAITQAHRLLVSPIGAKLRESLEAKKQQEADAEAYRQLVAAQKAAATEPVATQRTSTAQADSYNPVDAVIQG